MKLVKEFENVTHVIFSGTDLFVMMCDGEEDTSGNLPLPTGVCERFTLSSHGMTVEFSGSKYEYIAETDEESGWVGIYEK